MKEKIENLQSENRELKNKIQELEDTLNAIRTVDVDAIVLDTENGEEQTRELSASNQQLRAVNQQLQASDQQLRAANQQLEAGNQQLIASEKALEKEKIFSEKIVETADAIIVGIDKDHIIKIFNQGAEQITGYKKEEVIGKDWFQIFFPKEMLDEMNKIWKDAWGVKSHSYINPILAKSGEEIIISWQNTGMYDSNDVSEHLVLSIGEDITERKQAEKELLETRERLQFALEGSQQGMWDWTIPSGEVIYNDQWANLFGYKPDEIEPTVDFFLSHVHPKDLETVNKRLQLHLDRKAPIYESEHRMLSKGGEVIWTLDRGKVTERDHDGKPLRVTGLITNISKVKQTEEKLKESEERFRNLVNTINSGVAIYKVMNEGKSGCDYIIQDFNQFALKHEKVKKEEVVGKSLKDIRPNIDEFGLIDVFRKVWKTGESTFFPAKVYIDENYSNYYENRVFKLPSGEIVAVYDDVTERERVGLALNESEERFNLAMNASNDGLFDWNLETNEIYYSPAWEKMLGYEDHELQNDFSIWEKTTDPEDVKKSWELQQKLISKQIDRFELEFKMKHKDGSWVDILSRAKAVFEKSGKAIRIVGTHTDITERKKAEEEIRESEKKFRLITENSIDCIWQMDLKLNFSYISPAVKSIFGYTQKEWIGTSLASHAKRREFMKMAREALKGIKSYKTFKHITFEAEMLHKNGSTIPIEVSGKLIKNKKGIPIGLQGSTRNITERKQAEEKIIQQNEFLNNVTESLTHPFYVIDVNDYSIIQGNSASGYSAGSSKTSCHALTHNSDIPCTGKDHPCPLEIIKKTNQPTMVEHIHFDEAGCKKNVEVYCYPIFDKNGAVRSVIEYSLDITKRKQAEKALKESEAVQSKMAANIGDVIVIIDDKGFNRYKSPNIEKLFGWKPDELVGQSTWDNVHPDDLEHGKNFISSLMEEPSKTGTTELSYKRKDGSFCNIQFTAVNLFHDPDINGILGNYHDITERKQAEEELIKAKEKAEESDRLKSSFLSNMSHEIRTPMNGILGFTDLLKKPQLSGEQKNKFIRIIEKSGERMLNTINDIIELSKIESGQIPTKVAETNIKEVMNHQFAFFKTEADSKGLTFNLTGNFVNSELIILTDTSKLEAILRNLLKNALKFTNTGFIEFGLEIQDKLLNFYVKDSGIGIPQNKLEVIFERFIQADVDITRPYEGSGLGLSIAMAYANFLGGNIKVDSEVDKGSTFYFTLPNSTIATKHSNNVVKTLHQELDLNGSLILIVEDDVISYNYLEELLAEDNLEILHAHNGEEAINIVKSNLEIALILMDLKMPIIDGYIATSEIRKFNKEIPIIAQTAYAMAGDRSKAIEAGCTDYLTKPIKYNELKNCIIKNLKSLV